jgi:hypothetical protein
MGSRMRGSFLILSELRLVLWLAMMNHRDGEGGMVGEENAFVARPPLLLR